MSKTNIGLKGTNSTNGIAHEFLSGQVPANNISLGDMLRKQMVIDFNENRETFNLTYNSNLTNSSGDIIGATDDASADNLLMNSTNNVEMSEIDGYARRNQQSGDFFNSGSGRGNGTIGTPCETINVTRTAVASGCIGVFLADLEIYVQRDGNDLVWYGDRGIFTGVGETYRISTSGTTFSGKTELARLDSVATNTFVNPVYVACRYLGFSGTLNFIGQSQAFNLSSNQGSTGGQEITSANTKVGFRFSTQAIAECQFGSPINQGTLVQWDIKHPDYHDNVTFTMSVGIRGTITQTQNICC